VKVLVNIFWVVKPYSIAVGYQCFEGPCWLHLQCEMEAESSSKMLVS